MSPPICLAPNSHKTFWIKKAVSLNRKPDSFISKYTSLDTATDRYAFGVRLRVIRTQLVSYPAVRRSLPASGRTAPTYAPGRPWRYSRISTAANSICSVIWQNLISAIPIAKSLGADDVLRTEAAVMPRPRCVVASFRSLLPNPTVHIALGKLRRVVNALIERHGAPDQVVVELARELKASKKQREQDEKSHTANRRRAETHREILAQMGLTDTSDNRIRLRLHDELAPLADKKIEVIAQCIDRGPAV